MKSPIPALLTTIRIAPSDSAMSSAAATASALASVGAKRTRPYQPLLDLGSSTGTSALIIPLVDIVQPATQTLIETGYDRSDYGNLQPGTLLPPASFNPVQTAGELVNDIPLGITNALTRGLQPLPGSDPNSNTVQTDSQTVTTTTVTTNQTVAAPTVINTNPLVRLSIIAKPSKGIASSDGTKPNNPSLETAVSNFIPFAMSPRRSRAPSPRPSARKMPELRLAIRHHRRPTDCCFGSPSNRA
jgi:hypothetical protein